MEISNVKKIKDIYTDTVTEVTCIIDNKVTTVPINLNNRHYAEIKKQVDAGELTIADADQKGYKCL